MSARCFVEGVLWLAIVSVISLLISELTDDKLSLAFGVLSAISFLVLFLWFIIGIFWALEQHERQTIHREDTILAN